METGIIIGTHLEMIPYQICFEGLGFTAVMLRKIYGGSLKEKEKSNCTWEIDDKGMIFASGPCRIFVKDLL